MSTQQYLAPTTPYSLNDSELAQLRQRLAQAERVAARATDWVSRARAEQDVKSLQRDLNTVELQRKVELAQQRLNQPAPDLHAIALARSIGAGLFVPPTPYYVAHTPSEPDDAGGVPAQETTAEELGKAKMLAMKLQAVIDDPATSAIDRAAAIAALDRVKAWLSQHDNGTSRDNPNAFGHQAANNSFDELAQLIEAARKAGVVASYDLRRPKHAA
jgi:hypothetical protein